MTQLEAARKGLVTDAMKTVAAEEKVTEEIVRAAVADGTAVIPLNPAHANCQPVGVGRMFTTKINANLGRSVTHSGKGDGQTQPADVCPLPRGSRAHHSGGSVVSG